MRARSRAPARPGSIIAAELGIPIEYEERFREMSLGDLAGKPYDSIANDPTFDPKRSWVWRAPNGESHEDVLKRVAPVLDAVAKKYPDDEIVVVSHGGVMRAVWAHVTGKWEDAHVPPNCGIVVIEHHGGRYREPEVMFGETPASETRRMSFRLYLRPAKLNREIPDCAAADRRSSR